MTNDPHFLVHTEIDRYRDEIVTFCQISSAFQVSIAVPTATNSNVNDGLSATTGTGTLRSMSFDPMKYRDRCKPRLVARFRLDRPPERRRHSSRFRRWPELAPPRPRRCRAGGTARTLAARPLQSDHRKRRARWSRRGRRQERHHRANHGTALPGASRSPVKRRCHSRLRGR